MSMKLPEILEIRHQQIARWEQITALCDLAVLGEAVMTWRKLDTAANAAHLDANADPQNTSKGERASALIDEADKQFNETLLKAVDRLINEDAMQEETPR